MNSWLSRDSAGSLDLHGGTGDITAICSCGKFLEVYKEDVTFRIKTPETIDPGRTNPNVPFVAAIADTVGSSSPAVARVLLQGRDIIETIILDRQIDKEAVIQLLYQCKESIIGCEKAARRVSASVEAIIKDIDAGGLNRNSRGALNPFPQVLDLDLDATTFLINAKRSVQLICRLPAAILGVSSKDNNFDHLAKTLSTHLGPDVAVTKFVGANAAPVRYLIELRNWQEHPNPKQTTIIENFSVAPDGRLTPPMWHVSGETRKPIRDDMLAGVEFLVQVAELMLIHLAMHASDKRIPFVIIQLDPAEINVALPIKYRLSIDTSKIRPDAGSSD